MVAVMQGRPIVAGDGAGEVLVSHEPLSFWGGYDSRTGEIIDRRHPLSGQMAAGRVLAIPYTRGSSTTTAVLLEAIRTGTAPVAILTTDIEPFFALASIVADEMYQKPIPVVALSKANFATLKTGQWVSVQSDGSIVINFLELP